MRMMGSVKTTKYQMALINGDGTLLDLGFTARNTKQALWNAMLAKGPEIVNIIDMPDHEDHYFSWSTKRKAWEYNGYAVVFTGNTKAR